MSKALKNREPLQNEPEVDSKKVKSIDRPARSNVRNKIHHLDPDDWDDLDLETFEKM